jgi:hypothetical protein
VAPTPGTKTATQISCKIPTIAAMPETKPSQEKGGLEITIVPVNYKAIRQDRKKIVATEPNFGEAILAPSADARASMTFVEETIIPRLVSSPDRLQFAVRVNNKLSRVFRGQGSVVQINVAGKLMPINRKDYAEFMDSIVPPRNEAEFKIFGPPIDELPAKGTLGLFLYDVVTATDTAGNVTEKQNYEWLFSYSTEEAHDEAVGSVKRGWMKNAEIQRMMQR